MSASTEMLIIVLPKDDESQAAWLRVSQGCVIAQGQGEPEDDPEARLVAFAPTADTGIDWLDLPDVPRAQRDAIARRQLADQVLGSVEDLHVATQGDAVVWVAKAAMARWLAALPRRPDSLIPLALAIPAPTEGMISATIAGQNLLRGYRISAPADPAFIAAFGQPANQHSEKEIEAALIAAASDPPLDLLTGPYGQRQAWFDGKGAMQLAKLAIIALGLVLILALAQIWRTNRAASQLEESARSQAAAEFPQSADPVADLNTRLAAKLGGGAGFLPTMAAVSGAITSNPLAELTRARFDSSGTLEVGLRVPTIADAALVKRQIEASGFTVDQNAPSSEQGRIVTTLRVRGS